MPRLTLRTLLAYIDDTLEPTEARTLGKKVAASEEAKQLVERIKRVTRRRGLATPVATDPDDETADPNTVAAYLDNALDSPTLKQVEETCLESDVHLAEVAACHQILTLVLTEPVRVPPNAHRRMYQLVQSPASVHKRRPNKTLPIGGAPPSGEQIEADSADAALLLGMNRYTASTTWAARIALFGAAAVLVVLLAGAVLLSLRHQQAVPPETSPGHSYVLFNHSPQPTPEAPKPKDMTPPDPKKPSDTETGGPVPAMPPPRFVDVSEVKPVDPGPGLGDPIPPPSNDPPREIAQIRTNRVLVVTQPRDGGGQWVRLKVKVDDLEPVLSNTPVMALPGYKAELLVDKKVQLRLWGNVPEQLPYRVLESRVKIHSPPPEFDADITLLAGRIYLKSEKRTGAKVRLRLAGEVWDVTLPDREADVLVELISWFEPGTVYARKDGSHPKLEGRVAVVFGTASFAAPARFKKFENMTKGQQVTWDTGSGTLSDPKMINPDQQESLLNPNPTDPLKGELNRNLTRLLTLVADSINTRESVHAGIKNIVGPDLPDDFAKLDRELRDLLPRLAIYAHAALADCNEAGAASLTPLVDVLRSELPWLARQAVVTAFVNWLARDRGNTALLFPVLTGKMLSENDADWLLRLLRGFVSPTRPDPARLDELVDPVPPRDRPLLGDPEVALREAALWNLMVVRLESWVPLPLNVNVGAVGAKVDSDEYRKFLAAMKADVEALKKRQPAKKP